MGELWVSDVMLMAGEAENFRFHGSIHDDFIWKIHKRYGILIKDNTKPS